MNKSVKNSKVHHYADDTNLLLTEKSLKKINKQVNQDLALICLWLRANKISLNTSKTEIILHNVSLSSNILLSNVGSK